MQNAFKTVFVEPAQLIIAQISQFLVAVLLVLFFLIIGWFISNIIKSVVTKGLKAIKLDQLSERIELSALLSKGGITYTLSELIGVIFYWLALLVTFVVAVNAVGLTVAADLLNKIVLYVPNIVAAIFILVLGMFVATVLKNIVKTAANNAGVAHSAFLARCVEIVVMVFAAIIALEQLNINAGVIEKAVSILIAALGLAFALAFGLGCKDIAAKYTSDFIDKLKSKK